MVIRIKAPSRPVLLSFRFSFKCVVYYYLMQEKRLVTSVSFCSPRKQRLPVFQILYQSATVPSLHDFAVRFARKEIYTGAPIKADFCHGNKLQRKS